MDEIVGKKLSRDVMKTREFIADNPPAPNEVVIRIVDHMKDGVTKFFEAWWLPGRPDTPDRPACQTFLTNLDLFQQERHKAGYTTRVLPDGHRRYRH